MTDPQKLNALYVALVLFCTLGAGLFMAPESSSLSDLQASGLAAAAGLVFGLWMVFVLQRWVLRS